MNYTTLKEWTLCLLNPKRETWLRISQEDEDRLLMKLKLVVLAIFIAASLAGMLAAYRFNQYLDAREAKRNMLIQGVEVIEL